jgi:hypothetical protein
MGKISKKLGDAFQSALADFNSRHTDKLLPPQEDKYIKAKEKHIGQVRKNIVKLCLELLRRANHHDDSKLKQPESKAFASIIPKLAGTKFGTKKRDQVIDSIKPAVEHHFEANRHHPEHFKNGVDGMNLVDVMEMVSDWVAAAKGDPDSDVTKSINVCLKKYEIDDQLGKIIKNTVELL